MDNIEVAATILNQLGGKRFTAMTGAKQMFAIEKGLQFKIGKNNAKANRVRIVLNSMDTYDMYFERVTTNRTTFETTVKINAESLGCYDDMLQSQFTAITGLDTHL